MAKNLFNPIMGSEERVLSNGLSSGSVYFTTDTRKIYLDIDENNSKIPMGGNVGLFYGNMILQAPPVEGQKEFEFKITEILGNESGLNILVPNTNDLILNTDGCFYKVLSSYGTDIDAVLITEKLTIAGTGGGGGTGSGDNNTGSLAGMTMSRLRFDNGQTVLYQSSCSVSFAVKITDDLGDPLTGNVGTYDLYINNIKKPGGVVVGTTAADVTDLNNVPKAEINTIDVGPYLTLGENINVKISVNGVNGGVITRAGTVSTTNMALTWDYDETVVNSWDETVTSMNLKWTVGGNLEKTTHIIINDEYENEITITSSSTSTQNYELKFAERNLWHGAHKIEMYATADIGGGTVSTPSIRKNIIIAKSNNNTPIISCSFFDTDVTQYNTAQIPIIVYNPDSLKNTVTLIENSVIRDTWTDVENCKVYYWSYTPTVEGTTILTIQSGRAEKSLTLLVNAINIDINEISNYGFRFKASEFSSNTNVIAWNSNGYSAQFTSTGGDTNKFDWHNGGLKTEQDENKNSRQFLCIKAGSKMTINYPLFYRNAHTNGKCLKVIFKATRCKDYDGQVLKCHDGSMGLIMRAQNAVFNYAGKKIEVPYCEDEYIEFELDISPSNTNKRYIRPWLDGVPAGVSLYSASDNMQTNEDTVIEIGSDDCDVYLYMIKMYESHLTDADHLDNFIADAPNASEMVNRFERNDILDENGEISYSKLAEKNPSCFVHLYNMARMTKTKNDPVDNCSYTQFHGSKDAVLSADDVTVKVQGTSSAAYGLAAFNLDSKFTNGFTDLVKNEHIDGWSMSSAAIPINYFCTKVNVASSEGTNNALNQEWYNRYQPYQTVIRGKKKSNANTARDCMEFIPGVIFIQDNNQQVNDQEFGGHGDNVFKDTPGYVSKPYYKMYSVGCMGNSKKNVKVFHDDENPYECCVENGDNQLPGQWMTDIQGGYSVNKTFYPVSISSITAGEKTLCPDGVERDNRVLWETAMDEIYGFRYPDGIEDVKDLDSKYAESMIQGWYRFVHWMAHSNPQSAYERVYFKDGYYLTAYENAEEFAEDPKTKYVLDDNGNYIEIDTYDSNISDYYTILTGAEGFAARNYDVYCWIDEAHSDYQLIDKNAELDNRHLDEVIDTYAYFRKTNHVFGATNKKLTEAEIRACTELNEATANDDFSAVTFSAYTFKGYKAPDVINGEVLNLSTYQKDYEPVLKGLTIDTYSNTYTHDTYEYRMAKMLSECEQYLCMDSIVFHYLFIERHTMVDNVAKNTFWSTEDGLVWNLTKNYDNDTSDGNDNQGKLTLHYGLEPGDVDEKNVSIFNAGNSVWLSFIKGLYDACAHMYQHLDNKGAWSPTSYLALHKEWQSAIPERCWIEDYYRKYLRPYEIYNSQMFLGMHEGGKKTHQRAQYETYQNYYISSKYFGTTCQANKFVVRAESKNLGEMEFPIQLYADCYVRGAYGSGTDRPNLSMRCKRNTDILIKSPIVDATDATIYLWPSNLYQQLGNKTLGLNKYQMTQFEANNAKKLRTISLGVYGQEENSSLEDITFAGNENLENVYVAHYTKAKELDLTQSPGLIEVDARGSGFATITLPENAPTTAIRLENPVTLTLSKLTDLQDLSIKSLNKLETIRIEDIDRSEVNSKFIIAGANNLRKYRLEDILWTVGAGEVDTSNNTIGILEKLKALSPADDLDRKDALIGTLTVTEDAYNGDSAGALAIYETYAKANQEYVRVLYPDQDTFEADTRDKYIKTGDEFVATTEWASNATYYVKVLAATFPNLDIVFEGSQAVLYTVNIYDGDGHIQWKRKIAPGGTITEDFLKYGPDGSFTSADVQKTSTAKDEYQFLNQWIIKDDAGREITTLNSAEPLYTAAITSNIHMYPQFHTYTRSYTISVKMKNPITSEITDLISPSSYPYGTKIDEIIPETLVPYVDSSSLKLLEVYDFKGYTLVEGSSTLISSKYQVTGDATLWAIFKLESNVKKIIHPEWFTFTETTYDYEAPHVTGLNIAPKAGLILKGKITLPATAEYNGNILPVISVSGFGSSTSGSDSDSQITHVFMQDGVDSSLKVIRSLAFCRILTLQYFDFDNAPIRVIEQNAFRQDRKLTNTSFGSVLWDIHPNAFNGALTSDMPTTITLPATLKRVQSLGLAHLNIFEGSTLNIGSETELSQLNLSQTSKDAFQINAGHKYKAINFYSALYDSPDEIISGSANVASYFSKGLSDIGSLTVK